MARGIILTESFDWTTTVADIFETNANASLGAYGRNGTNGLRLNAGGTNCYARKNLGAAYSQMIHHFAFMPETFPATYPIFSLLDAGNYQLRVTLGTDGLLRLVRGPSLGTVIATGATAISFGVYHAVAVKVVIANSGGTFEVVVDGVTLTFSGDTQDTANVTVSQAEFGYPSSGITQTMRVDDWVAIDSSVSGAGYLVDPRVCCRFPTGAGNYTQWTPSAGSNYQNVDDTSPDGDTTYNEDATAGHKDSFTLPSLPVTTGIVYCQNVKTQVRKTDAGARTVRNLVRAGGTDQTGATVTPGTTYGQLSAVFEQDATPVDWTISTSNSLEVGYELVA